jgi:hypothetical protein
MGSTIRKVKGRANTVHDRAVDLLVKRWNASQPWKNVTCRRKGKKTRVRCRLKPGVSVWRKNTFYGRKDRPNGQREDWQG